MFKVVAKRLAFTSFSRAAVIPSITTRFCSDQTKDHRVPIREPLDFNELKFESKVPVKPHVSPINQIKIDRVKIDEETIRLLELLSLVNVDSK